MKKILVRLGPNLNMVGTREKNIYGEENADTINQDIKSFAENAGFECDIFQSNHEGTIVDIIQDAYKKADAIIINPAAYTHTSIAIHDALVAVGLPAIEVHLSNIAAREEFRKISYVGPVCVKSYIGFGFEGYEKAIKHLKKHYVKD